MPNLTRSFNWTRIDFIKYIDQALSNVNAIHYTKEIHGPSQTMLYF